MPVSKSKRSRYTAPKPKNKPKSPLWVPCLMFALLGSGMLLIILNYIDQLPGGNNYVFLAIGLVEIAGGMVVATTLR